jgi:hypothetical protein
MNLYAGLSRLVSMAGPSFSLDRTWFELVFANGRVVVVEIASAFDGEVIGRIVENLDPSTRTPRHGQPPAFGPPLLINGDHVVVAMLVLPAAITFEGAVHGSAQ